MTVVLVVALGGMYYRHREAIVALYISDDVLQSFIIDVIWLMCLNTVPEVFKGYLKGVMKALTMQHRAVIINFAGCWLLQGSLVWLFVF